MKNSFIRGLLFALISTFSFQAFALDLAEARSKGLVGEKQDGYIAAVAPTTPEIKTLIDGVNSGRKTEYNSISQRNGQPLDVVQKLAAAKIIQSLASGQYFQDDSGKWVKK